MENLRLKELDELIKSLTALRNKEDEKYRAGALARQSLEKIKMAVNSLSQLKVRGEKIDSARRNNLGILKEILKNLEELNALLRT